MKVVFVVQGDGRGHMTQAIAMREMLESKGHCVVRVLVGSNQSRSVPAFFRDAFECRVNSFESPGFSLKHGRGISTFQSALHTLRCLPAYTCSLGFIESEIRDTQPDLVVNFLEPLLGYLSLRRRVTAPILAVAHHFMFEHPGYPRVSGRFFQRLGMKYYVRLTGANATRLALSFYRAEDMSKRNTFVCPPILRRKLFEMKPSAGGRHLLVYLLNHGYASDVIRWHRQRPDIRVHCFFDRSGAPPEEAISPNLTFHALNGHKFLHLMAEARGVVCTAGFESVSEAAYLGKPLLMVPVQNHPEQFINAADAELAGLGMRDTGFDLCRLLSASGPRDVNVFRQWVDRAPEIVAEVAERAVSVTSRAEVPASRRPGVTRTSGAAAA
jgi:uncharacterized protein (TIGR00661 family)